MQACLEHCLAEYLHPASGAVLRKVSTLFLEDMEPTAVANTNATAPGEVRPPVVLPLSNLLKVNLRVVAQLS